MNDEPILRVSCADCNAAPGQRCADDNGKRSDPHLARYSAERDAFLAEHGWEPLGLRVVTS